MQGPALIFQTLPNVFADMAGGRVWGTLFFLFMIFASFSTVLAVFENILAICMDTFGWSRKKATRHWRRSASRAESCRACLATTSGRMSTSSARAIFWTARTSSSRNLLLPIGSLVYLSVLRHEVGLGL